MLEVKKLGLRLKKNMVIFIGAYLVDAETPLLGKLAFDLSNGQFSVWTDGKGLIEGKLKKITFENLNSYISELSVESGAQKFTFQVGIFPDESRPVDNITESIKETFDISDEEKILSVLRQDPHDVLSEMASLVKASIRVS